MGGGFLNGWCVLRTKARHTLRLAKSLGEDGFEVWTPTETRTICIPRVNVKRDVKFPIMPSYVFAKAQHLIDLIQLADMPVKPRRARQAEDEEHLRPHEDFRVMRTPNGIPAVSDADLTALRRIEAKRTPRKKAATTLTKGSAIRFEEGSFGGLDGVVQQSDNSYTVVCFEGTMRVKIPTCLLLENVAGAQGPAIGIAA